MTKENETFDVEAVMRVVGEAAVTFEAGLTPEDKAALKNRKFDDSAPEIVYSIDERDQAMSDFDALAAADAMSALADEIQFVVNRKMEMAYRQALEVYYTAEELARDPEHAELVPHVEAMRRAHEEQYGMPIPPKAV
ncbi:MAG: hypothetical protein DMF56_03025 [Acidobacteria bacterium]|nr:MAG: hypothetical protein DMF56_03025 [Acidobacteriota bacterium]